MKLRTKILNFSKSLLFAGALISTGYISSACGDNACVSDGGSTTCYDLSGRLIVTCAQGYGNSCCPSFNC